jgi:thiamine transport system permease protein
MRRLRRGADLPSVPVALFVLLFAVLPAGALFVSGVSSVGGMTGAARVIADPLSTQALLNSVVQGALSAGFALLVGYPVGVFLGRYRWRGRSLVEALLLVPFLLPSIVVVTGIEEIFGPSGWASAAFPALSVFGHGVPAIVLTNLVFNVALVALFTTVGVETRSGGALEDAVRTLGGGPWRAMRDAWGPTSWVGAATGGLLTFLFSALAFAAPLLLCGPRCYTLEARVWALAQVLASPEEAAVLALGMFLLLLLPTIAYLVLSSRARGSLPGASRRRPIHWARLSSWIVAFPAFAVVGAIAIFLLTIVGRTLAPSSPGGSLGDAWAGLFSSRLTAVVGISTVGALLNTLFFAAVASGIALLFSVLGGYSAGARGARLRGLELLLFAPLLISPIVLSFSLASFWRPILGGASTIWLLVLLSQTILTLPFAVQSFRVASVGLSRRFREAARLLGSPPFSAYLDAELPMLRGALLASSLFAFALSIGEFTATYFLVASRARFTTLPVELYALDRLRQFAPASALAAFLIIVSFAALAAVSLGGRRVAF